MIEHIKKWILSLFIKERSQENNTSEQGIELHPIFIPDKLAKKTQNLLRSFSKGTKCEGLVYWAGLKIGQTGGVVTTLIVPDAQADPGSVQTSSKENLEVIKLINDKNLVLLGQAHSHPPGSGNQHSHGDDLHTFSPFKGHISIISPNYAAANKNIIDTWGIHRFYNGKFKKIDPIEDQKHLKVFDSSIIDRRLLQ